MDCKTFRHLLSTGGLPALQAAIDLQPREEDFLAHFQILSRRFPPDLARAALEAAILQLKARDKFPWADRMYFTREALEQASSYQVASYRAQRYKPFPIVADLGCSIGGDTLALAEVSSVIGVDGDPLRLAMAQANLQALRLAECASFVQTDINYSLPFNPIPPLFFDPARRMKGKRAFSVSQYQPPLSVVKIWLLRQSALGVKISPGVDLGEVEGYDAEVEFISSHGELKEAVLWFGALKTAYRRATLLPGPHTLIPQGDTGLSISTPLAFLYEPDPAILRAGLVRDLGARLGAFQIDPEIAYLTADRWVDTPFARAWAVEDWFSFNLKRLRDYLRRRNVGRVVVKKRGSPLQPEALIRDLRLRGEQERVIFLTHVQGKAVVIMGREVLMGEIRN